MLLCSLYTRGEGYPGDRDLPGLCRGAALGGSCPQLGPEEDIFRLKI
jgi:hypothetical protein